MATRAMATETNQRFQAIFNDNAGAFRYESCGWLATDGSLQRAVAAFLGKGNREREKVEFSDDWTGCKCRLHVAIECDVEHGLGCKGLPPGKHATQQGLYGGGHKACTVEPGVRVNDKRVFDYVEGMGPHRAMRKRFMSGHGCRPSRMGAGYCYTHLFPDEVVVRIARLLGPRAAFHRVLRYFLVFGRRGELGVELEEVAGGEYHVREAQRGGLTDVGFVRHVVATVDPNSVVGMEFPSAAGMPGYLPSVGAGLPEGVGERFRRFREWAEGFGVTVPDSMEVDFGIATTHGALLPVDQPAVKEHARKFELLGDRLIKFMQASQGMLLDLSVAALADYDRRASNTIMAGHASRPPLAGFFEFGGLIESSKVRGDLVESLIGLTMVYLGYESAVKVVQELDLGVCPAGAPAKIMNVKQPEVASQHVLEVISDALRRGGDPKALQERINELLANM